MKKNSLIGTRQLALHTSIRIDWPRLREACAHAWPELVWSVGGDNDNLWGRHGDNSAASVRLEDRSLSVHVHPAIPPSFDGGWQVFGYITVDPDDGKRFADVIKQARRLWKAL